PLQIRKRPEKGYSRTTKELRNAGSPLSVMPRGRWLRRYFQRQVEIRDHAKNPILCVIRAASVSSFFSVTSLHSAKDFAKRLPRLTAESWRLKAHGRRIPRVRCGTAALNVPERARPEAFFLSMAAIV